MAVVTTSSRGQIVIPKEIRERLQIVPGKKLLIKAEGDHAIIRPLPDDPVDHFCGVFKGGSSLTKALLLERRRERKRRKSPLGPPFRKEGLKGTES
jgi:AbrB family looped-hinge helix DNA binding protein